MDTSKNLYTQEDYTTCVERIGKLSINSKAQWGKMDVAQMLAHCAEIQETMNGKALQNTPFMVKLFKGMIRNVVVSKKPYKKSMKTHPQYIQKSDRNFENEKARLLKAIDVFYNSDKEEVKKTKHDLFGLMTLDERGWACYKPLNYHQEQFGV